jgi:hypothetical protein
MYLLPGRGLAVTAIRASFNKANYSSATAFRQYIVHILYILQVVLGWTGQAPALALRSFKRIVPRVI